MVFLVISSSPLYVLSVLSCAIITDYRLSMADYRWLKGLIFVAENLRNSEEIP
ncbi:protein of unknown function [Limnospira indica PCC 8005]|uniref:Uncharacterized protein n=1 Tax=Limnospira indica PCC 8005 TaxID=376219 RepID=A0A9P1P0S8_9CYAN|nr:protein of unknown function [Limnospira indica PCC 8005]